MKQARISQATAPPEMTGETGPHSIRVLISDDHPLVREGLRRLLSLENDLEIVGEAADGESTVALVEKLDPDVVLLDLRMPGMDGFGALQRIQKLSKRTKVIVLTASEDKNEFVQAMKMGCSGIVLKQTASELIVKSIRRVHAGEIWLDSHTTAAVMRQFAAPSDGAAQSNLRCQGSFSAEPAGTRDRGAGGAGLQEQGDGREDVHQRADGQEPSPQHLRQAGRVRPPGTGAVRDPQGASHTKTKVNPPFPAFGNACIWPAIGNRICVEDNR